MSKRIESIENLQKLMKPSLKISLRKANFSDIEFLWYLRNQPDVYKHSFQNKPVDWEEHINWIIPNILGVGNKKIFIIEVFGLPVGQARIDYLDKKEAEVSISILKEFHGKGIASEALKKVIRFLRGGRKVNVVIAQMNKSNLPSVSLFEKLGFKFLSKRGNWLKYNLKI